MARFHREAHYSDGFTDQKGLQQTSATKSREGQTSRERAARAGTNPGEAF